MSNSSHKDPTPAGAKRRLFKVDDVVYIEHRGGKIFKGEEIRTKASGMDDHNVRVGVTFEGCRCGWHGVKEGVSGWEVFGLTNCSKEFITDRGYIFIISFEVVAGSSNVRTRRILNTGGSNPSREDMLSK